MSRRCIVCANPARQCERDAPEKMYCGALCQAAQYVGGPFLDRFFAAGGNRGYMGRDAVFSILQQLEWYDLARLLESELQEDTAQTGELRYWITDDPDSDRLIEGMLMRRRCYPRSAKDWKTWLFIAACELDLLAIVKNYIDKPYVFAEDQDFFRFTLGPQKAANSPQVMDYLLSAFPGIDVLADNAALFKLIEHKNILDIVLRHRKVNFFPFFAFCKRYDWENAYAIQLISLLLSTEEARFKAEIESGQGREFWSSLFDHVAGNDPPSDLLPWALRTPAVARTLDIPHLIMETEAWRTPFIESLLMLLSFAPDAVKGRAFIAHVIERGVRRDVLARLLREPSLDPTEANNKALVTAVTMEAVFHVEQLIQDKRVQRTANFRALLNLTDYPEIVALLESAEQPSPSTCVIAKKIPTL